jgi:hypothetical protein
MTLTMRVEADGLPFEVLPALSLPKLDGVDVYPDKAVTGTRDNGATLVGRREQSFAVVPNRVGDLVIPEVTLRWWNVQSDQLETARIPERSLKVLPAAGAVTAAVPPASVATTGGAVASDSPASPARPAAVERGRWFAIALASAALWLLTIVVFGIWWVRRRRKNEAKSAAPVGHRNLRQDFIAATGNDDIARQEHALLAWAQSERAGIRSLGDLAAALASDSQKLAIATLQRARFADIAGVKASGAALASAFDRGFAWRIDDHSGGATVLPPLYPSSRR